MLLHDLFMSLILTAFSRHSFLYKLADPEVFRSWTNNNRVTCDQIVSVNGITRTMAVHSAQGLTQAHTDRFLSIVSFAALCVKRLKERILVLWLGQVTHWILECLKCSRHTTLVSQVVTLPSNDPVYG